MSFHQAGKPCKKDPYSQITSDSLEYWKSEKGARSGDFHSELPVAAVGGEL